MPRTSTTTPGTTPGTTRATSSRAATAPRAAKRAAKRRAKSEAPKPTLVLLVRHGQTPTTGTTLPGRAKGLHLADTGRAQAERVAERIGALKEVGAVYASPLERTRETAAPIGKATGNRVATDRGLLECEFGEWTGRNLKDLNKLPEWTTVQRYPSGFRFPDGESFPEMQTRMVDTIARLVRKHPGETIVAVSHADPIKAAVAHAMGTHLDLFQRIVISPCSVSAIWYSSGGPAVLTTNSTGDDLTALGLS
jgi:probable phosphoglycerate mutase